MCDSPMMSPVKGIDHVISEEEDHRRMAETRSMPRRAGVAAEGISERDMKDYVKPVFPKDAATSQKIKGFIAQNEKMQVLFGHMDSAALDDVVNAFEEVTVGEGTDIITQGAEGDCLYVVNEGQVDIFVARKGPDGSVTPGDRGSKVVTFGPGALFGELALMYTAPRAATVCIATPTCLLWKLNREPFRMLLMQHGQQQYAMYEGWLSEVQLFKDLNHYELSRLSEIMESNLFDADEEIIKQGEPGDKFYILEDGTCAAYISGTEGEKKVKDYLNKGEYFGEIALLNNEPRRATIRATGEGASVISVSQEDFTAVLGPIRDRLAKDIDRYPQYAQFLQ